jgi:hypothetical protein
MSSNNARFASIRLDAPYYALVKEYLQMTKERFAAAPDIGSTTLHKLAFADFMEVVGLPYNLQMWQLSFGAASPATRLHWMQRSH